MIQLNSLFLSPHLPLFPTKLRCLSLFSPSIPHTLLIPHQYISTLFLPFMIWHIYSFQFLMLMTSLQKGCPYFPEVFSQFSASYAFFFFCTSHIVCDCFLQRNPFFLDTASRPFSIFLHSPTVLFRYALWYVSSGDPPTMILPLASPSFLILLWPPPSSGMSGLLQLLSIQTHQAQIIQAPIDH